MLTCREVAEQAEDWLDQNLSVRQSVQMRLHLAICKGCAPFISQMRVTRDLAEAAVQGELGEVQGDDDDRIDAIFSKLHNQEETEG